MKKLFIICFYFAFSAFMMLLINIGYYFHVRIILHNKSWRNFQVYRQENLFSFEGRLKIGTGNQCSEYEMGEETHEAGS